MDMFRIQRKRTKGWRMPKGAIYVGRPTKWGNPYQVDAANYRGAVNLFRTYLHCSPRGIELVPSIRRELRGKVLACWCPRGKPCHADVLLEVANAQPKG